MIKTWEIPNSYPNSHIGMYNKKASGVSYLRFKTRNRMEDDFCGVKFDFDVGFKYISKYHCLGTNSMIPLVAPVLANFLVEHAAGDFQLIDALITYVGGESRDYKLLNILSQVEGVDLIESNIQYITDSDSILGFDKLVMKKTDFMQGKQLARDADYSGFLYVSEELIKKMRKQKFRGIGLYDPEAF